ncbi:MAG: inositol monophosphatase [Parcubacteria group bacterium]|jgi:myo-inositol-1(or 4)-monophosphatase|nr:inositol monophosphatase [Parcubacteria group bacterium]|tara:strand:- start:449 stop:1213 length:765 start_codon:yes stop_codon:yes gene_type:complete
MNKKTVAVRAAKKAGAAVALMGKKKIRYKIKEKRDVLAEADLRSEKIIINEIKKNFPQHSILSEEQGETIKDSDYLWIIDPVDGTINFTRKLHAYCVSIALAYKDELILGVIYNPVIKNLYVAEKGKGAFLNGKRINVTSENKMMNMLLTLNTSRNLQVRKQNFQLLIKLSSKIGHIRMFGSVALHLAKVAAGKTDIYFNKRSNYWDYAAGIVLVREAGGMVTDFNGNEVTKSSKDIIASNGKIHQTILKSLNK